MSFSTNCQSAKCQSTKGPSAIKFDKKPTSAKSSSQQKESFQQIIIDLIKSAMAVCADDSAYQTTIDLFVRRSQVHEKSLWMLRSSLG